MNRSSHRPENERRRSRPLESSPLASLIADLPAELLDFPRAESMADAVAAGYVDLTTPFDPEVPADLKLAVSFAQTLRGSDSVLAPLVTGGKRFTFLRHSSQIVRSPQSMYHHSRKQPAPRP
jgi:hypothetical protein